MKDKYRIERLGPAKVLSPINLGTDPGDLLADFTPDDACVLADVHYAEVMSQIEESGEPAALELAGPRQRIYFDPKKLKVGVVTCGGICPGLNDVIRGIVMTSHYGYGVAGIYGFKYGFAGLNPDLGHPVVELTPPIVRDIHTDGGTILGTSRGPQDPEVMVDTLERMNIRLLFAIGGDGTFRAALKLHEEIKKRGVKIGIICIPKTIDNDIALVDRTFGFDTAVGLAAKAIEAAYSEAISHENGIGLVKLMGRNAGFIAASAALAVRNVNLVLIPEVPFRFEGKHGLFQYLDERFSRNKSTVIVVAEGAGQRHMESGNRTDASGNLKLGDIGQFIKGRIHEEFGKRYIFSLKYIDPSYMIRSQPASWNDSIFCGYLAQAAVHAGISGRTGMAVGRSHGKLTHIPIARIVERSKAVDPEGQLWLSVLESTGQPFYMTDEPPKNLGRFSFIPRDIVEE